MHDRETLASTDLMPHLFIGRTVECVAEGPHGAPLGSRWTVLDVSTGLGRLCWCLCTTATIGDLCSIPTTALALAE